MRRRARASPKMGFRGGERGVWGSWFTHKVPTSTTVFIPLKLAARRPASPAGTTLRVCGEAHSLARSPQAIRAGSQEPWEGAIHSPAPLRPRRWESPQARPVPSRRPPPPPLRRTRRIGPPMEGRRRRRARRGGQRSARRRSRRRRVACDEMSWKSATSLHWLYQRPQNGARVPWPSTTITTREVRKGRGFCVRAWPRVCRAPNPNPATGPAVYRVPCPIGTECLVGDACGSRVRHDRRVSSRARVVWEFALAPSPRHSRVRSVSYPSSVARAAPTERRAAVCSRRVWDTHVPPQ